MVLFIFDRTCVFENNVCHGIPLCPNKIDLKICKERSFDDAIVPFRDHSYCQMNKTNFRGQQIGKEFEADGIYHCFNRYDENPFNKENEVEKKRYCETALCS